MEYTTSLGRSVNGDFLHTPLDQYYGKVKLILTSPPFALILKKKYGNPSSAEYLDWFIPFALKFHELLTDDGSLVIDFGGAYQKGDPVRSLYAYEVLLYLCKEMEKETGKKFYLAQEFYHHNPARLPTPAEWVTIRKIRVKDSVNVVWWLSKSPYPKANNQNVLTEYSESQKRQMKKQHQNAYRRPSGHIVNEKTFFKDNGGAIPSSLLSIANTTSNSKYIKACKEQGLEIHPARFPEEFADFFIKFLTDKDDLVLDPFAGSNTTGYCAEKQGRRWLATEINNSYWLSSKLRFNSIDIAGDGVSEEERKREPLCLF